MTIRAVAFSLSLPLSVLAGCASHGAGPSSQSPQTAVDELLAADRAFAAGAAKLNVADGIAAMFADDVRMAVPGSRFSANASEAAAALRAVPDNLTAHASWAPIRGGISADGTHGFTFGYMTVTAADGKATPMKYLSYWIQGADGWHVSAYRRRVRAAGDVSVAMLPPSLPARMVATDASAATQQSIRQSLDAIERAFSRDAQTIGLDAAFVRYGAPDAINLGGPNDKSFVMGPIAIGKVVSVGEPAGGSSVNWAPSAVRVASSGDLGITIGAIHPNKPAADGSQSAGFPFFTVWHRARPGDPWRYIAE